MRLDGWFYDRTDAIIFLHGCMAMIDRNKGYLSLLDIHALNMEYPECGNYEILSRFGWLNLSYDQVYIIKSKGRYSLILPEPYLLPNISRYWTVYASHRMEGVNVDGTERISNNGGKENRT